MTSPNLAVPHVAAAQNQKEVTINDGFDALDAALTATLSVDCSAGGTIPVTATQVRRHARLLLEGTPAEAFTLELAAVRRFLLIRNLSGQTATVRNPTGDQTVEVAHGQHVLVYATGANLYPVGGAGGGSGAYEIGAFFPGAPEAGILLLRLVFASAVAFEEDLAGSLGMASVAADATAAFDIRRNGSSIGTMTFAATETAAALDVPAAPSFVPGDTLEIIAPDPADATLADISITLKGERA